MADTGADSESTPAGGFALHCRGDVRLYCGDTDCTPKSKKGRALLAILAAEQRPLTRVKIIDLLWSDRQEEQARASLRTLLADLKEQFDSRFDDLLIVDRERVALRSSVRTDLTDPTLAKPAGELFEGLDHIDPELDEWLRTERERWGQAIASLPVAPGKIRRRRTGLRRWALALVLASTLVAGALLYTRLWAKLEQPVVAVLKFKDLTGKNALLAEGLAEELRIQLAQQSAIEVLGRQTSEADILARGSADSAKRLFGVTHLVEGAIVGGDTPRVSIRLVETSAGKTIWNRVLPQESNLLSPAHGRLSYTIADQITDTVEQFSPAYAFEADSASYMTLFEARELLLQAGPESAFHARELLAPVVARFPRFVPALAAIAEATIRSSNELNFGGPLPAERAQAEAEAYAHRATQIAPRYALAHATVGYIENDPEASLKALSRAVELSPGNSFIRTMLGTKLMHLFREEEALPHLRLAAKLNPLRVRTNIALMRALASTGRIQEVKPVASAFFQASDIARDKLVIRSEAEAITGDLSASLAAAIQAHDLDPDDFYTGQFAFNTYLFLNAPDLATPFAPPHSLTEALMRDDVGRVSEFVRSVGPEFWVMANETEWTAEYLVKHGRNAELIASYDKASRHIRNLDLAGYASLIIALRQARRQRESDALLQTFRRGVEDMVTRGTTPSTDLLQADVEALSGNCQRALGLFERAFNKRWWSWDNFYQSPFDRITLACLNGNKGFEALRSEYDRRLNRERREAAAELRRLGKIREATHLEKLAENL